MSRPEVVKIPAPIMLAMTMLVRGKSPSLRSSPFEDGAGEVGVSALNVASPGGEGLTLSALAAPVKQVLSPAYGERSLRSGPQNHGRALEAGILGNILRKLFSKRSPRMAAPSRSAAILVLRSEVSASRGSPFHHGGIGGITLAASLGTLGAAEGKKTGPS